MKRKLFYGWLLVVVTLFAQSIGMGTTIYMYSVVADSVGREFSVSRSLLMTGSMVMLIATALLSPIVGTLLDRYPVKWIYMVGALIMGLGFILLSLSTSIWHFIACYALFFSVGVVTLGPIAAATLLSRWFIQYRGLAVGISAVGAQLGGFVYPPIVSGVIETFDWRVAMAALGIFIIIIVPIIAYFWVVDRPSLKNLHPDGNSLPSEKINEKVNEVDHAFLGLPFRELCAQRNFWLLAITVTGISLANLAMVSNLTLFATDLGESVVRGAFLISLLAFLGICSSPLAGWVCDKLTIKFAATVVTLCMAIATLIFSVADSYSFLLVATFFHGVANGAVFPLWAAMVGRLYDVRVYGQVMGTTAIFVFSGAAIGPFFAGWVYDQTDSYRLMFLLFLAMLLCLIFLIARIRVPSNSVAAMPQTPVS